MADIDNVTVGGNNYNLRDTPARNAMPTQGQVDDIIEALDTIAAKSNQPYNPSNLLPTDYADDTNQTHKFATAAQLTQIETNKNNILFVAENGATNYVPVATDSYNLHGITATTSNGEITISGTADFTFSLYIVGKFADDLAGMNKITSKLPDVIAFTGAPNTDNKNRLIFALYNGSTWVYSGSTNDLYHDLTGKTYTHWFVYLPIVSGNSYNGVWKPMIVPKSLYDAGFTDYQPYALSNVDLTTVTKQNENNILSVADSNGTRNKIFVNHIYTGYANGVTYTVNGDGTVTVNGTPSGTEPSYIVVATSAGAYMDFSQYCNGDYVLSGCPSGGAVNRYRMYFAGTGTGSSYIREDFGDGVTITQTSYSPIYLIIYIYNGYTANNLTFKPMICSKAQWNISHTYQPYSMSNVELTNNISLLNTLIATYRFNNATPATITLPSSTSRTLILIGYLQGIGNVNYTLEIDGSGVLTVKNSYNGSTVSSTGISFDTGTKSITLTGLTAGYSTATLIATTE